VVRSGNAPPPLREPKRHLLDLAQPDCAVARGQPDQDTAARLTKLAPERRRDSPQGGRGDGAHPSTSHRAVTAPSTISETCPPGEGVRRLRSEPSILRNKIHFYEWQPLPLDMAALPFGRGVIALREVAGMTHSPTTSQPHLRALGAVLLICPPARARPASKVALAVRMSSPDR